MSSCSLPWCLLHAMILGKECWLKGWWLANASEIENIIQFVQNLFISIFKFLFAGVTAANMIVCIYCFFFHFFAIWILIFCKSRWWSSSAAYFFWIIYWSLSSEVKSSFWIRTCVRVFDKSSFPSRILHFASSYLEIVFLSFINVCTTYR